jgi:hypothetical protein
VITWVTHDHPGITIAGGDPILCYVKVRIVARRSVDLENWTWTHRIVSPHRNERTIPRNATNYVSNDNGARSLKALYLISKAANLLSLARGDAQRARREEDGASSTAKRIVQVGIELSIEDKFVRIFQIRLGRPTPTA